jgi:hypothetical protein
VRRPFRRGKEVAMCDSAEQELLGDGKPHSGVGHVVRGVAVTGNSPGRPPDRASAIGASTLRERLAKKSGMPAEELSAIARSRGRPSAKQKQSRPVLVHAVGEVDAEAQHDIGQRTFATALDCSVKTIQRIRREASVIVPKTRTGSEEHEMPASPQPIDLGAERARRDIIARIDREEARLAETLNWVQWSVNVVAARFPEEQRLQIAVEQLRGEVFSEEVADVA